MLLMLLGSVLISGQDAVNAQQTNSFDPSAENRFVQRINAIRQQNGVPALSVDAELVNNARSWSTRMADAGEIFHTSDQSVGISQPWQFLGENVGVGDDVQRLFDAFVASPTHLHNILDPRFDAIGVGVYWRDGAMWTVQRYMQRGAPVQIAQVDPSTTRPPTAPKPTAKTSADSAPPETADTNSTSSEPADVPAPTAAPTATTIQANRDAIRSVVEVLIEATQ